MRFGENSRKGASSLVIVMVVVVIALAGTLVYTTLDRTVLTTDGYALPGSTIEYTSSNNTGTENSTETVRIVGYSNGSYFSTSIPADRPFVTPSEYYESALKQVDSTPDYISINIPGLGNTSGVSYNFTTEESYGSQTVTVYVNIVTILHGLPAKIEMSSSLGTLTETFTLSITASSINVGSYVNISENSIVFSSSYSSNPATITVSRVSNSVDGFFVYHIVKSDVSNESYYYVGDSKGIPQYVTTGSTMCEYGSVDLYYDSNGLTRINWNGDYYPDLN